MPKNASSDKPFVRLSWPALVLLAVMIGFGLVQASSLTFHQTESTLTISPPSLIMRVGQSASANVTLSGFPLAFGQVCFAVDGFPTSGFVTTFNPECANLGATSQVRSVLTVEATPAAAPQSFTALVVAGSGNWTDSAHVGITVTPAMPTWIPWSILFGFILLLISPFLVERMKRRQRRQHMISHVNHCTGDFRGVMRRPGNRSSYKKSVELPPVNEQLAR